MDIYKITLKYFYTSNKLNSKTFPSIVNSNNRDTHNNSHTRSTLAQKYIESDVKISHKSTKTSHIQKHLIFKILNKFLSFIYFSNLIYFRYLFINVGRVIL